MSQEPKWLYRLEETKPGSGLWYDENGKLVWTIGKIDNCPTKYLPMDHDWRYCQDGRKWHSSCTRKEDLARWYTLESALDLIQNHGFVFTRYLATEYKEYELETVFIKDTCLAREELDIRDVFGEDVHNNTEQPQVEEWHTRYINGIESNGIECWWTIGQLGSLKRFYKIVPVDQVDTCGVVQDKEHYFILYESFDNTEERCCIVAVYEHKWDAMNRVMTQLQHIDAIKKAYCER